jgi:DNA-binding transcriptional LysR family regulator
MRNMDLDSLQIFKAVVDYGGISKAASHLNRVQSNITTRVKNLEDKLGVKLFERLGGRLVLSSEGRLLMDYAEKLLRLSSEAESALRSGKPAGILRIGTMESTAAMRLPSLLSQFHRQYPDVRIELITGTSGALIDKVHQHDIEAAFVAEPFIASGLERQTTFTEELVLIAPKAAPAVKTAKDLKGRTIIAFASGCSYRRILEDWMSSEGLVAERIMELASYHAMIACVAAGSGIAIVPRALLDTMRVENEVNLSTLPQRFARASTCLVWRKNHTSASLEALRAQI